MPFPKKRFTQTAWKRGWRTIGGKRIYARSSWDANFSRYLEFQKQKGEIKDWEYEPETFYFKGIKRGCTNYKPDFRVTENNGGKVFHEVKGHMDAKSATKIKRFRKYFPQHRLYVIPKSEYVLMMKGMEELIPGWES